MPEIPNHWPESLRPHVRPGRRDLGTDSIMPLTAADGEIIKGLKYNVAAYASQRIVFDDHGYWVDWKTFETIESKCVHGYWKHAHVKCPWCHGKDSENAQALPREEGKPGNGWLLMPGDLVCGCGGPMHAGWGLWSGMSQPTPEEYRAAVLKTGKCYWCHQEATRATVVSEIPKPA